MAAFDPYHKWLGIPPAEQPPNHYRLLDVPLLESDPDVIETAAQRQTVFLRTLQLGPQADLAERLLNEVARARVTLLNTAQKAAYDNKLQQSHPLPADPVPDSGTDVLSAEIAYLRKTLEQLDQAVRQGKEDLEQERAELTHEQERLARGVAALKKEQELQRAQPPRRRLPPARSAGFKSLLARFSNWTDENSDKIPFVIVGGVLVLVALFLVSGLLDISVSKVIDGAGNVANRVAEERPAATGDQPEDKPEEIAATDDKPVRKNLKRLPLRMTNRNQKTSTAGAIGPAVIDHAELNLSSKDTPAMAIAPFDEEEAEQLQQIWADHLGTPVEITNSIGMKLKLIPPGRFTMGSPESEPNRSTDETQHKVWIRKSFYLSAYEVTQQQYERVMRVRPWEGKDHVKEGKRHPATYVTWDDAVDFCDKLSAGKDVKYRLPTEAEWEYACRAGTTTAYNFGRDAGHLGRYAWYRTKTTRDISKQYARTVGKKLPNPWGLYDMHGNVWEWCQDRYALYENRRAIDPTDPASGSRRVLRGGAFLTQAKNVRAAGRGYSLHPDSRNANFGFRVTRTHNLSPKVTTPTVSKSKPPAPPNKMSRAKRVLAASIKNRMTREQLALGDPVVNTIDMVLVPIPPGQFTMGSPESEAGRGGGGETEHQVRITKPFYLSAHEVTQQQYKRVMDQRPWAGEDYVKEGPGYPATFVNWNDAVGFCQKLSKQEGVEYRLPTEAQWEYACRAGTTTAYGFEGDASQLDKYAWYRTNAEVIGERYAHRVGEKLPNPWGLYDMHGNVWECCQDWYGPYESLTEVSDPTGAASGRYRVLRGGALTNRPMNIRAAYRAYVRPDLRSRNNGFRLTRTYNLSP